MSLDLGASIRTALLAEAPIYGLLGEWSGEPSIFTRRPVPSEAQYPMIVVNPDIAITDQDALRSKRPIVTKDVIVYGDQPDGYRVVEQLGYAIRELFHRERFSIDVDGYDVVQIVASGPNVAPTDDDKTVGRVVTLTISLRKTP